MAYKFVFLPDAEKDIRELDPIIAKRILKKIKWFSAQIDPLEFASRLHQPAIGDARFRVGDYRVVVIIDEKRKSIGIVAIGHRREIYK